MIEPFLAFECQDDKTKHVECCKRSPERADHPQHRRTVIAAERFPENFILTEEAGERRNPGDRNRADQKCPVCHGHVFLQSTHFLDVLLVVHSVNDRAGTEE
jgi:hypothetical protein